MKKDAAFVTARRTSFFGDAHKEDDGDDDESSDHESLSVCAIFQ